jgi:hypothetical protein
LLDSAAMSSPRKQESSVAGPCGRNMDPRFRGDDRPWAGEFNFKEADSYGMGEGRCYAGRRRRGQGG